MTKKEKGQLTSIIVHRHEQGVALVVVLLFLILIMLAGVMAVRQSNTNLKTATADQINTVLLQSSDSANQKLEASLNGAASSTAYQDATSIVGVFGSFIADPGGTKGNEYIYCFNPRKNNLTTAAATIRQSNGGTLVNNGICDLDSGDSYTSDRQAVMTQVSVTLSGLTTSSANASATSATASTSATSSTNVTATTTPFGQMVEGKDTNSRGSIKYHFDIHATSLLPSFNSPIGCLTKSSITTSGADSLINCVHNANTPVKMLYEQADVQNISSSTVCIPFGAQSAATATSAGSSTLQSQCVL